MMMNLEQMKIANGHFELDGREYILLKQAYIEYNSNFERDYFTATAICMQDETDESGWRTAYCVEWEITGDDEDDQCNADWDNPCSVEEIGECNMEDGRIC